MLAPRRRRCEPDSHELPSNIGLVIVALNIGNTNVAYGFIRDGQLGATGHAATPDADMDARLEMLLDRLMGGGYQTDTDRIEIVFASVVPEASEALRAIAQRRGWQLLEADATTIAMPMGVDVGLTAGHDRLVNGLAAARLYGAPAIVVDLGTATTFDVVDASGSFVGGAIAPGIGLGLEALATRTAQLPRVRLALPRHAVSANTTEAIQSGTILGHVGMVEYLVAAMANELGARPKVILTGGLSAHPWAKSIGGVDVIDPLLTLRGLALVHAEHLRVESVAQA